MKTRKTNRGFCIKEFKDAYGEDCSIQESSCVEPHLWIGVDKPYHKIQKCDVDKLGLDPKLKETAAPETNQYGWCDYPIPAEVSVNGRMHINQAQAKQIVKVLTKWIESGNI